LVPIIQEVASQVKGEQTFDEDVNNKMFIVVRNIKSNNSSSSPNPNPQKTVNILTSNIPLGLPVEKGRHHQARPY
jgi:hypothetical protein